MKETYPMPYTKDLTQITTLRLSPRLHDAAQEYASFLGISFSEFVRQSMEFTMESAHSETLRGKDRSYKLGGIYD